MSKPSILLINRVYPRSRGATGRLLQDLAQGLEQSGWKVTVLTTGDQGGMEIRQNITIHRLKAREKYKGVMGYSSIWVRLLWKAMGMSRHDIVLTLSDPPFLVIIGSLVARMKHMVHVHWCHDLYPDLFEVLQIKIPKVVERLLFSASRRAMKKARQVVVVGRCMARRLAQTGVDAAKITMIANWVDFEVIAPNSTGGTMKRGQYRTEDATGTAKKPEEMFRDDSPKFRVLYAGNIGRAHPMRSVIEAASILSEYNEIEFVFIGDRHVHSILARERDRRGLNNIKFMPYQPIENLRDVMESGDVHLVTMRQRALGMLVPCKFYSGLTVGRPTVFVGPQESEIATVIDEYKAGIVVPVNEAQALADAIYHYRSNGQDWFEAQEGALRAGQAYHPNHSLHKWLEVLEQARGSR